MSFVSAHVIKVMGRGDVPTPPVSSTHAASITRMRREPCTNGHPAAER